MKMRIYNLQNIYRRVSVKKMKADLLQGTLVLLVLKALALGPLHGLGVSRRIEQITRGTFQVKPGSLFPALHRMEEAGFLRSSWGESENNRRAKYYRLTKAGQRQLEAETESWQRIALAITAALKAT
jgi:transcriptional regulator